MRRPWLIGLMAGTGLVAAGCSSTPSHPSSQSTTTSNASSATTTTNPDQNGTTTSSPTTTSTAATGCTGVTASTGQSQGAAGTITGSIVLSESGTATCTFSGYPTMALFAAGGATIPVTMVDGLSVDISPQANAGPQSVTLSASSQLEFTYQYSDVPSGNETSCPSSTTVTVTAPGQSSATAPISLSLAPCDNGTIRVSPLYAAG